MSLQGWLVSLLRCLVTLASLTLAFQAIRFGVSHVPLAAVSSGLSILWTLVLSDSLDNGLCQVRRV